LCLRQAGSRTLLAPAKGTQAHWKQDESKISASGSGGPLLFGLFIEIYVDTPLKISVRRATQKGSTSSRVGKLPILTGIGSAYEPPERADLIVTVGAKRPEALAQEVLAKNALAFARCRWHRFAPAGR
jgi:adenylylsulfate kinase